MPLTVFVGEFMALKKITHDLFNISGRIKHIDSGYFIVFNTKTGCFEVHHSGQQNTFCLNAGKVLNKQVLNQVYGTKNTDFAALIKDIEAHNAKVEQKNMQAALEMGREEIKLQITNYK